LAEIAAMPTSSGGREIEHPLRFVEHNRNVERMISCL
jgi:hypothetical protein